MPELGLLAIEGGGSKCSAALQCRERMIMRWLPIGLNPNDLGCREFERRLRELVGPLLAGEQRPSRMQVCAALAGVGKPAVRMRCGRILKRVIARVPGRHRVSVVADADALTHTFAPGEDCVGLIAGTGSIAVARKASWPRRKLVRVGGWGGDLDVGSGTAIGQAVLTHVLKHRNRVELGPDVMTSILCSKYGVAADQISSRFPAADRRQVALLSKIALEAYNRADVSARMIVYGAVDDLVDMVLAVKWKACLSENVAIYVSGGLFRSPVLARLIKRRLLRALPHASLHYIPDTLPAILAMARGEAAGSTAGEPTCERL